MEQQGIPAHVSDRERCNHLSQKTVSLFQLSPNPGSSTADRCVGVTPELDCALKELFSLVLEQTSHSTANNGPTLHRSCARDQFHSVNHSQLIN